jgi:2-polyprenyl-3-methyl-5-hydroxy-6-metoxy-1,4-benzoquinol methylase
VSVNLRELGARLAQAGERPVEGHTGRSVWIQSVSLYRFACGFVRGRRVLDVACGSGYGSRMLLDAGAAHVTGVDLSADAVQYARSRYGCAGLEFAVGDVRDLSAFTPVEVVVSIETIEHVPDGAACVAAAAQALTPDGLYVVSTPNCAADLRACRGVRPANPHHHSEYDAPSLAAVVQQHFGEVSLYGQYWRGRSPALRGLFWLHKQLTRSLPVQPLTADRLQWALPRRLVAVARGPLSR